MARGPAPSFVSQIDNAYCNFSQLIATYSAMTSYWSEMSKTAIPDLQRDTRTFTLNVLTSTVFREKSEFIGSTNLKVKDLSSKEHFRDAVFFVHNYLVHLMVIPYQYLLGPMVPESLSRIGWAAANLKQIMTRVVEDERTAIENGTAGSGGLVTTLVRAIDHSSKRGALSLDETLGNIFVIHIAGLDTTANVLAFAFMRLAGEPDIQDWLYEEIVTVTGGRPVQDWGYDVYPKLNRCQAVFLETMRIYPPIMGLPKMTAHNTQTINIRDRSIAIPPGFDVIPLLLGVQTDPEYWDDPFAWKPKRWIQSVQDLASVDAEELFVPRKGTYFPWSEGAQVCVGKKLSQVEAVAALAASLATHRLSVKPKHDETEAQINKRVIRCCDDNNSHFLLEMNNASQVQLQCIAR